MAAPLAAAAGGKGDTMPQATITTTTGDAPTNDAHAGWRRPLTIAVGVVGFLLATLATAWACTTQSHVSSLEPSSAPAGAEVTVSGEEYAPGEKVEVRWDTDDGPTLATGTVGADGTFTLSVTLPTAAEPGEHLLFAIAPDLYPAAGRGMGVVEIQASAADDPTAPPAEETTPAEAPPAPADDRPATTSADEGSAPGTQGSTEDPAATSATGPTSATGTEGDDARVASLPRSLQRDHVTVPASSGTDPAATAGRPATDGSTAAADDTWAGTPADARAGAGLGTGVGLLAVGLVVLFAGFAVTVLTGRHQRAEVPAERD